jgi:hypothetical protein
VKLAWVAVLGLVLALAACAADGGARTFKAGDVTVVDTSGLVKAAEPLDAPLPSEISRPTATKGDSLTQVVITWTGNSCIRDWTVHLRGNALELAIEPGTTISGCEGMEGAHRIRLDLNRVVQADGIDVTQAGS